MQVMATATKDEARFVKRAVVAMAVAVLALVLKVACA
jgi:hypothetical protein